MMEAVPPATELETELLDIWRDILGITAIGVTHQFFEIGGHSLAAIRILARLRRQRPQVRTTIADLFNNLPRCEASLRGREGRRRGRQPGDHAAASGSKPMSIVFPGLLVSTREYVKLVDFLGRSNQPPASSATRYRKKKPSTGPSRRSPGAMSTISAARAAAAPACSLTGRHGRTARLSGPPACSATTSTCA